MIDDSYWCVEKEEIKEKVKEIEKLLEKIKEIEKLLESIKDIVGYD